MVTIEKRPLRVGAKTEDYIKSLLDSGESLESVQAIFNSAFQTVKKAREYTSSFEELYVDCVKPSVILAIEKFET